MFLFFKKDKLAVIRLAAFIAFMLAMFMSWNLWFSDRSFPMATFFNWLPEPNGSVDLILILLFVIFFGVFVFKPNWKVGGVITLLYVYWALLDQNRLQPFFFELIFVVFAISYYKGDKNLAKQCLFKCSKLKKSFIYLGCIPHILFRYQQLKNISKSFNQQQSAKTINTVTQL